MLLISSKWKYYFGVETKKHYLIFIYLKGTKASQICLLFFRLSGKFTWTFWKNILLSQWWHWTFMQHVFRRSGDTGRHLIDKELSEIRLGAFPLISIKIDLISKTGDSTLGQIRLSWCLIHIWQWKILEASEQRLECQRDRNQWVLVLFEMKFSFLVF